MAEQIRSITLPKGHEPVALSIELDEKERGLRNLLVEVASWIDQRAPRKDDQGKDLPTVLRFTGGWVRDKLLNIRSHDIDIAVNNMTGHAFALEMNEYLRQPGNLEKYGVDKIHGLHDIKSNPEKSKHLDTVTTRLYGLDLDIVNLRKEVYDEASRIPQIEATDDAEEDALRRDATINAMFYNLQDDKVEDLTQRGFEDLQAGIIRTPLDPSRTFKDDPLRILRLIRFASRYNFAITTDVKQAMMDDNIKAALQRKISRERVGVELEKMLKGPDPQMALSLINDLGLYATIFSVPDLETSFVPNTSSWPLNFNTASELVISRPSTDDSRLEINEHQDQVTNILISDGASKYLAWVLACFVPYVDAPLSGVGKMGAKAPPSLAAVVAREGIKAPNKVSDVVSAAVHNAPDILRTKDDFLAKKKPATGQDARGRDTLGNAIRGWGPTWRSQATFAYFVDIERAVTSGRDARKEWAAFLSHLKNQDLLDIYDLKPLVDGRTLAKALNVRPGPWMREALDVVMSWQLRNPQTATAEAAITAVTDSPQSPLGKGLPPYPSKREPTPSTDVNTEVQHQDRKRPIETDEAEANSGELTASLIRHVLSHCIRPLFSKTTISHQQDTVTELGRAKQTHPLSQKRHESLEDESLTRPWKSPGEESSLDLLRWSIAHLTPALTETQWPLLIPPLLTLLDDMEPRYRTLGAILLTSLLRSTTPSLLARTGLAEVFHSALKPSLHYLPTLTPEPEATALLSRVYPALMTLLSVQHAGSRRAEKLALAQLLHEHILPSIAHVGPAWAYPGVTAMLVEQLGEVVSRLGIDSVSEVPHVLPILHDIVAENPFAADSVEGLRGMRIGVAAVKSVIAAAWMRAPQWRGEVVELLSAGWVRVVETELGTEPGPEAGKQKRTDDNTGMGIDVIGKEIEAVKAELKSCVEVMMRAVDASGPNENEKALDFPNELGQVLEADPRLDGLLGASTTRKKSSLTP